MSDEATTGNVVDLRGIADVLEAADRIRSCPGREVRLLIDGRSPLANRFNLELLRKSADQAGKQVRLLGADARLGRVARLAGLVVEAGSGPTPAPTPVTVSEVSAPTPFPARQSWEGPSQASVVPVSSARRRRQALYAAAIGCLVLGLSLAAAYMPSASITLEAQAEAFTSSSLTLGLASGQPARVRNDSVTQHGNGSFKATGVKSTPGAQARGTVIYTNDCSQALVVGSGQRLQASGGIEFIQQGQVTVPNQDPITGGRPGTASAPVIATSVGTGGNVGEARIGVIEDNFEHCLMVTNPQPTSGGSDDAKVTQITQQDLDGARDQLQREITQQVTADLARRAASGERLSQRLSLRVAEFATDHAAGDTADSFSGSMTLEATGTFYSEDDVRRSLVERAVGDVRNRRPDRMLLEGAKVEFTETTAEGSGPLTFQGIVTGYLAPRIEIDQIRERLAGKPRGQAEAYLSTLPVRSHKIEQGGPWLPVMPLVGSRIDIHYLVDQSSVQSS